jgi:hypothetical protein
MPLLSTPRIALFLSSNARRHHRAGRSQHSDQPGAGIGRAAHHLQRLACTGVDGQHLQLVGIGMRRGGQHPRDPEARQLFRRVRQLLDLDPERVELRRDVLRGRLGVEVVLQPGERELHARAPTPADSVGWSRNEKP